MKYRVHLYPRVHVVVEAVEAEDQEQAIEAAYELFEKDPDSFLEKGWWDESQIDDAMVDEEGDDQHLRTCSYTQVGIHWEPT